MMHSVLANPGVNKSWEVLVHRGIRPHGDKVNRMIREAQGTHIVVWDDDDWIAADYIEWVLPLLDSGDDFVGYRIVCMSEGRYSQTVVHDAQHEGFTGPLRGVSQKCPIRRELALDIPFPDDYYQDGVWSAQIQRGVESYSYVDRDLYFYDYWFTNRYRSVGMWPYDKSLIRWF